MKNKIIIALDFDNRDDTLFLVDKLSGRIGAFKIGLELFNLLGPDIIRDIQSTGNRVFYDAKFHDIPNTVAGAISVAARWNLWMINLHCSGGLEMMNAARNSVDRITKQMNIKPPLLIGVSVLTSISDKILMEELGSKDSINSVVLRYARLAQSAGLDGLVCSGHEIPLIRNNIGEKFILVVPGIRPEFSDSSADQKRVIRPKEAIQSGADYLVIGRPVTRAKEPIDAVQKIIDEIS